MGFSARILIRKGFSVWGPDGVVEYIRDLPAFRVTPPVCPSRSLLTSRRHWWWISNHAWAMRPKERMDEKVASALNAHHRGWTGPPCVSGNTAEGNSEDPGCVIVHHGTRQHEVVQAMSIAYQMAHGGQDTPHETQLCAAYDIREQPCPGDGRQDRKGAKMISRLSCMGGAEVSALALRRV